MLSWWRVVPLLELVDSLEGTFLAELVEGSSFAGVGG